MTDEERSLALQLRQTREEQGKTLEQIHRQTGLSFHVLHSLEAGEFTVIEPVYIRLALRSYAENLGLNPTRIAQQFEAVFYEPPPLLPPPPQPRFSLAKLWVNLRP